MRTTYADHNDQEVTLRYDWDVGTDVRGRPYPEITLVGEPPADMPWEEAVVLCYEDLMDWLQTLEPDPDALHDYC